MDHSRLRGIRVEKSPILSSVRSGLSPSRVESILFWVLFRVKSVLCWVPFWFQSIRGWVPFGVESILCWVPFWGPFTVQSILSSVHSEFSPFAVESLQGLSPFGVQSILSSVHSEFSPIRGWVHLDKSPILGSVVLGSVGESKSDKNLFQYPI